MFGRGGESSEFENFIGDNPLGLLLGVGFLLWALFSVAKEDPSTAKILILLFIGLPVIGILLNSAFDILGTVLRWIFSADSVGVLLGIGFFYLVLRFVGDHLLNEKDKIDKNDKN